MPRHARSTTVEVPDLADASLCGAGEGIDGDLGWALAIVGREFRLRAGESMAHLPGGPRGYLVLVAIAQGPPSSQLALAQQLGVDKTVMTYLLDALETDGLVARRPDPSDRRARQVVITPRGTQLLDESRERLAEAEQALLAVLSESERTVFRDFLGRLARSAQTGQGGCLAAELSTDGGC